MQPLPPAPAHAAPPPHHSPSPLPHPSAVEAYCRLAAEWGMSGAALALRFVLRHPLVASAVIGATSGQQLEELAAAARAPPLDGALVEAVDAVHARYPSPAP